MKKHTFTILLLPLMVACGSRTSHNSVTSGYPAIRAAMESSLTYMHNRSADRILDFEETKLKNEPERAQKLCDRILSVARAADSLDRFITGIQDRLITEGGGVNVQTNDIKAFNDLAIPDRILLKKDGDSSTAMRLKKRINDTRINMLRELDDKARMYVPKTFAAADSVTPSGNVLLWEDRTFKDLTLTAALTYLMALRLDLATTETRVLDKLLYGVELYIPYPS